MKRLLTALIAVLAMVTLASADHGPKLSGVAFVQGHGGHIALVDLATGKVARIAHGKASDAITLSEDGNTIYVFSLDGHAMEVDIAKGTKTEWMQLGKQHCGSAIAPDGTVWVSDMTDGHVYVYDRKTKKLMDSFPVSKSICGITFTKDGKTAFISDMPGAFINVVDVKTKKVTAKIQTSGHFLHRSRLNPSGTEVWASDGAEIANLGAKDEAFVGVGYAEGASLMGGVAIVDAKSKKEIDYVLIGGNPHDVAFTTDGKYALVTSRQIPDWPDSGIAVVDTKTRRMLKVYSACKSCHGATSTTVSDKHEDKGKAFLCGIDVNWKLKAIPTSKVIETPQDLGAK